MTDRNYNMPDPKDLEIIQLKSELKESKRLLRIYEESYVTRFSLECMTSACNDAQNALSLERAENETLSLALADLKSRFDQLAEKHQRLQQTCETLGDWVQQRDDLIEELREKYNDQLPQHDWLTEIGHLQNENGLLHKQLDEARQTNDLHSVVVNLSMDAKVQEYIDGQIKKIHDEVGTMTQNYIDQELGRLRTMYNDVREELRTAEEALRIAEDDAEQLRTDYNNANDEIARLRYRESYLETLFNGSHAAEKERLVQRNELLALLHEALNEWEARVNGTPCMDSSFSRIRISDLHVRRLELRKISSQVP